MKFNKHSAPPAGFQLAPMIDIIFLLLAFFIVTYQMTDQEKDLEIQLPTAEEGEANPRSHLEIVINIHESGEIVIDKKTYSLDALQQRMSNLVRVNKSQPVRVRGDAKTDYEFIVQVIDRCRKSGVWNISFATGLPKKK